MYTIDQKLADNLLWVLRRSCRHPELSFKSGKAFFGVRIAKEDFRNCLTRAVCEAEESRKQRERIERDYEENDDESMLDVIDSVVSKDEASNLKFIEAFIGIKSFVVLNINPDFTSDMDMADEIHTYCVDEGIADYLEKILVRCLYRFERNGNIFRVHVFEGQFGELVSLACTKPNIPDVTDVHDVFPLLDEDEVPEFDPTPCFYEI